MIKRYFFTGLALLLPAVVTILIIRFFINLVTRPFQNAIEKILSYYGLLGKPFLFLNSEQTIVLLSKALVILFLVALLIITGILARIFITNSLIRFGDYLIHRIPFVNKIYKAAQDVVNTLLADKRQTFSQVVLVPFPHEKAYSIGMVTLDGISGDAEHNGLISVFVPGTPNPTMGFMMLLKREQVIFIDMQVDDALKTIISCGVLLPKTQMMAKEI